MKKLSVFITSAMICTCIFCLTGCNEKNVEKYTFNGNMYYEGELLTDVVVYINGVEVLVSNTGQVELTNLNKGDIITFSKEGYICDECVEITKNDTSHNIYFTIDGFNKVKVSSNIDIDFVVNDMENGDFTIDFDTLEGYIFDGFYVDDILISTDVNYIFPVELRQNVFIKFDKLHTVTILNDDCTPINVVQVRDNNSLKLMDYVDNTKVFNYWKEDGQIVSNKQDFEPVIIKDTTFYLCQQNVRFVYNINDRVVEVNSNIPYDIYIDNNLVKSDCFYKEIYIAKLTKRSGNYSVKLENKQYNISENFNVKVYNNHLINSASIVKYDDKFYIVSNEVDEGYTMVAYVNNKLVKLPNISKTSLYGIDITKYIQDGVNTLSVASCDSDNIYSKFSIMPEYNKQYTLPTPTYNVTDSTLNITNNDDYSAYIVANDIIVDQIINNQIDISKYMDCNLQVVYFKDYCVSSVASINIAFNKLLNTNYDTKYDFISIDKVENEVLLNVDTTNKTNIEIEINSLTLNYDFNVKDIPITDLLYENADNIIIVNWQENCNTYIKEYTYYYEVLLNGFITQNGSEISISIPVDYNEIYLNNVLLNNRFTTNKVDLYSYILSSGYVDIKIIGYKKDKPYMEINDRIYIAKFNYIKENITKVGNYLFVDNINNAKYYLNDLNFVGNVAKLDVLQQNELKIKFELLENNIVYQKVYQFDII